MAALSPFSSLVAGRRVDGDTVRYAVGDDWMQGRTCYGGVIAALAAQAMREVAGTGWPAGVTLRALQTSFVGPVSPGAVDVRVQRLRQGRNVAQVQATVVQGDQVAAALLGVYAAERASVLEPRVPARPPALREPDALPAPPPRPPGAPVFLEHFDIRYAEGAPPFSGHDGWTSCIHLRLKPDEAASVAPELQTVLLADLPPTPAISRLRAPAPNSSVSWALELRPVMDATPGGWWRADCESLMVEDGYVNHAATIWAPDGRPAAFGCQVVAVFA